MTKSCVSFSNADICSLLPFFDGERSHYTAKQWDEDAQLYYFNARWYDAGTARFVTEDPIRDGLNWYAYINNNPINYIDPNGLITLNAGVNFTEMNPVVYVANAANTVFEALNIDIEFDTSDKVEQGTVSAGVYIDSEGVNLCATYGSGTGTPELASVGLEAGASSKDADVYLDGESIEVGGGYRVPIPQTGGVATAGGNASLVYTTDGELIGGEVKGGASIGPIPVDAHVDYEIASHLKIFSFGDKDSDCPKENN